MNLHHNKDVFEELIIGAVKKSGIITIREKGMKGEK